ncbi:hypothetical protein IAR50_005872 [Cryptococcus sp. DSM 104548]
MPHSEHNEFGQFEDPAEVTIFIGCDQDPRLQGHVTVRKDASVEDLVIAIAKHIRLPPPSFFTTWNSHPLNGQVSLASQGIVPFSAVHIFPIKAMQDQHKAEQEKNKKEREARHYVGRDGSLKVRRRDRQKAMDERMGRLDGEEGEQGKKGFPGFKQFCNAKGINEDPSWSPRSPDPFIRRASDPSSSRKRSRPTDEDNVDPTGWQKRLNSLPRSSKHTIVAPLAPLKSSMPVHGHMGPRLPSLLSPPGTHLPSPSVTISSATLLRNSPPSDKRYPSYQLPSLRRETRRPDSVLCEREDCQALHAPPSYAPRRGESILPPSHIGGTAKYHPPSSSHHHHLLSRAKESHSPPSHPAALPSNPSTHITPPSPVDLPPSSVYKPPSPPDGYLPKRPSQMRSSSPPSSSRHRSVSFLHRHDTAYRPSSLSLSDRAMPYHREDSHLSPQPTRCHVAVVSQRQVKPCDSRPHTSSPVGYPSLSARLRPMQDRYPADRRSPISPPSSSSRSPEDIGFKHRDRPDLGYDHHHLPFRSISGPSSIQWGRF